MFRVCNMASFGIFEHVFPFLTFPEAGRLEVTSRHFEEVVLGSCSWGQCLCHAMKGFILTGECLVAASHGPREQRKRLKALATQLSCLAFVDSNWTLDLASLVQTERLATQVVMSYSAQKSHRATGGFSSSVIISTLRFPNITTEASALPLNSALQNDLPANFLLSLADPNPLIAGIVEDWQVSMPINFSMPSALKVLSRETEILLLQVAWRQDTVLLRITSASRLPSVACLSDGTKVPHQLEIDLCSLGGVPLLRSRGTYLKVNGPWRRLNGVSAALLAPSQLRLALDRGLVCLLCARDCVKESKLQVASEVLALHIDKPCGTSQ